MREVQYVFKSKLAAFDLVETKEGEEAVAEQRIERTGFGGFRRWKMCEEGNIAVANGAINKSI